ncbi:LamG-like jellyroll fold domain-containing protein [Gracilimonas sediminicola]|uniref:T9SS type A sorting domain-containing protein n=1 Tax=Gracilimonas sediminicola TaxID=2952158 RepID=A0A9X2RDE1_9BACT|nr:LamG-like jellyroll fold domain-containing protein [Gracilimonas sediminicola]MCP9290427.1 T9SS type A sorting domain-containing protein [Gracilimonas sediminicola]
MKAQILFLIPLFMVSSSALFAQTATEPSGSGTSEDPYLISSLDNLYWVTQSSAQWDKYYLQNTNIDASGISWEEDTTGFSPIGNAANEFTGSFDGQNYSITGIYINRPDEEEIGLFGNVGASGVLTGLHLKDVNITGNTRTGGLVGYNNGGAVSNSIVTGEVYGSGSPFGGSSVGGLAGQSLGSVLNSSFKGTVDGNSQVGGLVGRNGGSVMHSFVTGEVSCETATAGGLIGLNEDSGAFFYNYANATVSGPSNIGGLVGTHVGDSSAVNYALGDVTGDTDDVGGLVGQNSSPIANSYATGNVNGADRTGGLTGANQSTITNSYAAGTVTGTTNTGGFSGSNSGTITSGFWDTDSGSDDNGIGTDLSGTEMKQEASFSGFDFTDIWLIDEDFSFPFLRDILPSVKPGGATPSVTGRSISFGGASTDYVEVPHSDDFDDLDEITLEAWVYLNSTARQGFFSKNVGSTGWYLEYFSSSNAFLSSVFTASGARSGVSLTIPPTSKWFHLSTTYDGTDVKIYIDGKDVTSQQQGNNTGTITNNTNSIRIGDHNQNLDGKMDEVRIWNVALSQNEIQQNMFQKLSGDEEGLLAYLPFDEGEGTLALDESANQHVASLNGSATWESDAHPYGTFIAGDEGWRMMTVPASGVSYGELLDTLWTQGFTGADYSGGTPNVYTWDESSKSFTALTNSSEEPAAGTGFLIYIFDDDDFDGAGDGFPKMIWTDSTQQSGNISPALSFTDTGEEENDGWNLMGNPYGATIDWDAPSGWAQTNLDASFYVWSDSANGGAGDYLSWNGTTGTFGVGEIAPWQGFWVKANSTGPAITFSDNIRASGGILRKKPTVSELQFTIKNGAMRNSTIVMFSEQAQITKDRLDAWKLQSLNGEYLSLFTQLGSGSALDINAVPSDFDGILEIPLSFKGSTLFGEFDLSWISTALPEGLKVFITDENTGETIPLEGHGTYHFYINKQAKTSASENISLEPEHRVLSVPSVMKAKKGEVPRFILTLSYGEIVSNEQDDNLPKTFGLDQNYPNPFNPSTVIRYQLPVSSVVSLKVFDILGREVAALIDGRMGAGYHQVSFNARNLASGMYIYQLRAGNSVITKKLTLIK